MRVAKTRPVAEGHHGIDERQQFGVNDDVTARVLNDIAALEKVGEIATEKVLCFVRYFIAQKDVTKRAAFRFVVKLRLGLALFFSVRLTRALASRKRQPLT